MKVNDMKSQGVKEKPKKNVKDWETIRRNKCIIKELKEM